MGYKKNWYNNIQTKYNNMTGQLNENTNTLEIKDKRRDGQPNIHTCMENLKENKEET